MIVIESEHIPPSVNGLFVNVPGRGRVRSKKYSDWAKAAGWDYNGSTVIYGDFSVVITLDRAKIRKGSDLDNRGKAVLDLLVTHRRVEDDSRCVDFRIRYGAAAKGVRVEVASTLPDPA